MVEKDSDTAAIKSQLALLTSEVGRLASGLNNLNVLDKDMSVLKMQQSHTTDAVQHVRDRLDQFSSISNRADDAIHKRVDEVVRTNEDRYMTKESFEAKIWPIRAIVFGMAGATGLAVLTAVLAKVMP